MRKVLDCTSRIVAIPSFIIMMLGGAFQNPSMLFGGFVVFLICALTQLSLIEEW